MLTLQIFNNPKMIEESNPPIHTRAKALTHRLQKAEAVIPQSTLLSTIHDQQIYLGLTSTLLTLAKEAGTSQQALQEVSLALLHSRGLNTASILSHQNHKESHQNQKEDGGSSSKERYNWLERGIVHADSQALLQKLQKQLWDSREKESHFRCLQKYKSEKSDELTPSTTGSPTSKKDRFKRMLKDRSKRKVVESSDFFQFEVKQILGNSYRYENDCYRVVGSFSHLKTIFGHASEADIEAYSQIFNAILDKTDNLVVTGGEEGVIKIWHRPSGTLVKNIKGHTDFLNKLEISPCNKYLLSSAGDGLRFFDLKELKPLGGWRTNSIAQITSLNIDGHNLFLFGQGSFLYVLKEDTMLSHSQDMLENSHFYKFSYAELIEFDNCSILVISISPNKTHFLIGLQNGHLLVVEIAQILEILKMSTPGEVLTLPCIRSLKAHHQQIIQVKWNSNNELWATGAKDGRCCLWQLHSGGVQQLTTLTVNSKSHRGRRKRHSYSCTYICWNCSHTHFAAGFQENVEEEDSDRGRGQVLVYSLKAQRVTCELSKDVSQQYGGIRAMDAHPTYPNILLICEADGHVLLFDIFIGCVVNTFEERGYHILHPQFQLIPTECRFTKDGLSFLVATQYGSVSLYGYDSKYFFTGAPVEQFLQTDFQQIDVDEASMKALPRDSQALEDINNFPRGSLLNVRLEEHQNQIKVSPLELVQAINKRRVPEEHIPQIKIDQQFMQVIEANLREAETEEQIYSKTFEEIDRVKQLVLFHERERQFLTVLNLTNQKLKMLKPMVSNAASKDDQQSDHLPAVRGTRKLKRHSQRRVQYVDDFEYPQSEEDEFIADSNIDHQMQDEQEELSDLIDDDDEPRARRREARSHRRKTRQSIVPSYEDNDNDEPQIVTRRRKRDVSEELRQLENEYAPRKKVKVDEEESSEKKFSRLKKHISENNQVQESFGECFRCQLARATVFCKNCDYSQQFCQECSKVRGRRGKDKFSCLICLFLLNMTLNQSYNVSEEVYHTTRRSTDLYIPQLQDRVRYFFQGYEEFLSQNIARLNPEVFQKNENFRILPHAEDPTLLGTPLCEVISIDYFFPLKTDSALTVKRTPGKGEKSLVQMVVGLKEVTTESVFWVFYWPGLEFLLPEEVYSIIAQKDYTSSFRINQLAYIGSEELQIVEMCPIEDRFPQTIWRVIKVRKTEGKRLRGNTKEIEKRVNLWKLIDEASSITFECRVSPQAEERLSSQLEIWLQEEDSPFCFFNDYVDFQIYPLYREQVPVGMCLKTILERLKNHYYRGSASLRLDIQMLLQNSLVFNGPNHIVTKNAEELCSLLTALLQNEDAQVHHKYVLSAQMNPVDVVPLKGEEEKEQMGIQNGQLTDRRPRRKMENSTEQRRRRRESSDYEEQSESQRGSYEGRVATRRTRMGNGSRAYQEPRRMTRSGNRH